jgi:ABC-type glycerol-3-phosphate transport system permease component
MAVENPVTQRLVDWLLYALLLLCAAVTLMPFLYLICSAVKTKAAFFSSPFLPPGEGFLGVDWSSLTLEHFHVLFTDPSLGFGRAVSPVS